MRRRWLVALVSLMVLVNCLAAGTALAASTRVTRCKLRLRAEANATSETLATVPGGTEITVLGTAGGWTKTTYNGHTGYISSDYLMDLTQSGYYPLKPGDENQYVTDLQNRLRELGYLSNKADGVYGDATVEAVKAFQKANGIEADGLAGGETQRYLYGDTAKAAGSDASDTAATDSSGTGALTTYEASGTTLKRGSKGSEVKSLQERLIELGYLSGTADGVYGAATESAVTAFQKRSSLSADGKAGSVTQNLLYSNAAVKADGTTVSQTNTANTDTDYKTLKKGMTSDDVKSLQKRLKELGYLTSSATGYYGTQTLAAVESFQRMNGLSADGVAGAATQTLLFSSTAKKADETTTTSETTYATLKEGMKSSAVTTMQKKLRELGYMTANATGYFGSATKKALVSFQDKNGLVADGVAGSATLNKLYSTSALAAGTGGSSSTSTGKISGPSNASVKLLHWFNTIKPSLKTGSTLLVYDPSSGYGWNLRAMSLGRHCDSEPITADDTAIMNLAFGNKTTWTPKVVYVKLPSGTWTIATMHNTPHLSGTISGNNFDGHLCVHFYRDMDEAQKNDPNYGVQNQKALREGWKALTGETVN